MSLRAYSLYTLFMLIAIVTGYFYLDKAIANFMFAHQLAAFVWLRYIVGLEEFIIYGATIVGISGLLMCLVQVRWGKKRLAAVFFALGLCLAYLAKSVLKFVFARYWPLTWRDNNPSWIHDHVYGFQWFHSGVWYASFPSGHSTILTFAATLLALWLPKWRVLWAAVALVVIFSLIILNYHFLSDCFAGIYLGSSIALLTAILYEKTRRNLVS